VVINIFRCISGKYPSIFPCAADYRMKWPKKLVKIIIETAQLYTFHNAEESGKRRSLLREGERNEERMVVSHRL